ncbi:hypothetical protein [Brachybacterium sp. UNK5269]|uniref:hypothetical protein n=1 Tax=Brachybacterium sp. UNK5269 TaxID=3408576 RepID=UPI003BB11DBB
MILLAIVGLLGVWSSAGLLACGVFAVAFTTPILIPAVAQNLPGVMSSVLPWPLWTAAAHGLAFGVWAVVTLVLTAMGVALALTRRRPVRSLPLAVVGTALSPVLLLAGMVLVVGGTTIGLAPEIGAGLVTPQFGPVGVVLIGAALIVLGVAIAAVAPYALLAPALIVITLTGLFLTGLPFDVVGPERIGGLPVFAATATLEGMLMIGAEPGLAVLFLSFTVAAAVVRRRAGGRTRRVAAV